MDLAENAAAALDRYEQIAFRDPSLSHRDDDLTASITVQSFLRDLMHYSLRAGLSFEAELAEARAIYRRDRGADINPFEIDDTVQLRPEAGRPGRGIVIALPDAGTCVVELPGNPAPKLLRTDDLEPAPPFPLQRLSRGTVNGIIEAEERLIAVAARVEVADRAGRSPDIEDVDERNQLGQAIAAWSLTEPARVLEALRPNIDDAVTIMTAVQDPDRDPFLLAGEAFPSPPDPESPTYTSGNVIDLRAARATRSRGA